MGSGQRVEDKPSSGSAASVQLTMFKIWTCLSKKAVSIKNMSSLVILKTIDTLQCFGSQLC